SAAGRWPDRLLLPIEAGERTDGDLPLPRNVALYSVVLEADASVRPVRWASIQRQILGLPARARRFGVTRYRPDAILLHNRTLRARRRYSPPLSGGVEG